jgi:hypothetical protein
MATNDAGEIPIGMRRVCRRFERWRSGHKARLPIPNALWRAAAEAAREHGVFRAAKTLRLDYTKLKRVTEADAASARVTVPPLRFVELAPANGIAVAECVIELEGPRGKMRIQGPTAHPSGGTGGIQAAIPRAARPSLETPPKMARPPNEPCYTEYIDAHQNGKPDPLRSPLVWNQGYQNATGKTQVLDLQLTHTRRNLTTLHDPWLSRKIPRLTGQSFLIFRL